MDTAPHSNVDGADLAAIARDPRAVLLVGDSLANGMRLNGLEATLTAARRPVLFDVQAGRRSWGAVHQLWRVLAHHPGPAPGTVAWLVGTNDVLRPGATFTALDMARRMLPTRRWLLMTAAGNPPSPAFEPVNAQMRAAAAEHPEILVVDWAAQVSGHPEMFVDSLHNTAPAYHRRNALLVSALDRLDAQAPAVPGTELPEPLPVPAGVTNAPTATSYQAVAQSAGVHVIGDGTVAEGAETLTRVLGLRGLLCTYDGAQGRTSNEGLLLALRRGLLDHSLGDTLVWCFGRDQLDAHPEEIYQALIFLARQLGSRIPVTGTPAAAGSARSGDRRILIPTLPSQRPDPRVQRVNDELWRAARDSNGALEVVDVAAAARTHPDWFEEDLRLNETGQGWWTMLLSEAIGGPSRPLPGTHREWEGGGPEGPSAGKAR